MSYPEILLPKQKYFTIKKELPKNSTLIRIAVRPIPEGKEKVEMADICLFAKDLFGLSTNLIGHYSLSHLPFEAKKDSLIDFYFPWNEGMTCLEPQDVEYNYPVDASPIFINFHKLHNKEFPFNRVVDKMVEKVKDGKKVLQNGNPVLKLQQVTESFKGSMKVVHKPILCNFWHFELEVYTDSGELLKRDDIPNAIKRSAESFLKTTIAGIADTKLKTNIEPLNRKYYTATKFQIILNSSKRRIQDFLKNPLNLWKVSI